MTDLEFKPQNILVIDFGQLGDVMLSLPALKAIRGKFPDSRMTVMVNRSFAELVELAGAADHILTLDRRELRRGNPVRSTVQIMKFLREVRRQRFDLVIDLHSLSETNLLGFFSGARWRLFGNRESRSLDRLSNFRPKPPAEDKSLHLTDYYFGVLKPLGIERSPAAAAIVPSQRHLAAVRERMKTTGMGRRRIGIHPGAGHPSRRWPLASFAKLAHKLDAQAGVELFVFLGPEEEAFRDEVEREFPPATVVIDHLTIPELAAGLSLLDVLIANDSGPAHIAAAVGTAIVMLVDRRAPLRFLPAMEPRRLIAGENVAAIDVDKVYEEVVGLLDELGQRSPYENADEEKQPEEDQEH